MSANPRTELAASFDIKDHQSRGVASGTWTISAEDTNVRQCDLQLLDANGGPIRSKKTVRIHVWDDANRAALATGGSTGLAADTGTILVATHTAKLVLEYLSNANGQVNLTWTDTGTESVMLEALCDGVSILSDVFANA